MKNSKKFFTQAKKYIPGGVNSPVRAFSSVNAITCVDPPAVTKFTL